MNRVAGKAAVITGGAGGLGTAFAKALISEGASVLLTDIADASEAAAALGADFALHDVTSEHDWDRVMQTAKSRFGRIDVVVNNAGIALFADIENTSLEQWERIQRVNSTGTFLGCRAAVRAMREHGGSIVNISSVGAMLGLGPFAAYCASKGAIRSLTKVVATHCKERGYAIRCNSVHPGPIDTAMASKALADAGMNEIAGVPSARGTPEDVAWLVLYLASDESRHVNGAEFLIDDAMAAS